MLSDLKTTKSGQQTYAGPSSSSRFEVIVHTGLPIRLRFDLIGTSPPLKPPGKMLPNVFGVAKVAEADFDAA